MKNFIYKFLIFITPLYIYIIFIILVDPFNYFRIFNLIDDQQKATTFLRSSATMSYGSMLWKVNDFQHNPCPNIILGDSRTNGLDTSYIHQLTGEKYYNLAVHGVTIQEMADLFWYADKLTSLKKVCITATFPHYSDHYQRDLFHKALKAFGSPLSMFTERFIINEACMNFRLLVDPPGEKTGSADTVKIKEERMNKHRKEIRKKLSKYEYSEKNHRTLSEIASYCKSKGIELTFIIFPNYQDYHDIISELGLQKEEKRFRNDFVQWGPVYDFDNINELTTNKDLFKDLHHAVKPVYDQIIREVWGGELKYARLYSSTN